MNPSIETIESQPVAGIRTQTHLSEIGDKIGALMPELVQHLGDRMAGPPLARWHEWEGEKGEMEVAVPIRAAIEDTDRIHACELPGGRAVVVTHVGPYEGLHATWTKLKEWMAEQGIEGTAPPWEQYISDPTTTRPEEVQTRIVWPI